MKIVLTRNEKITLLTWLKRGYIETDDLPQLNETRDNWFLSLLKRREEASKDNKEKGL